MPSVTKTMATPMTTLCFPASPSRPPALHRQAVHTRPGSRRGGHLCSAKRRGGDIQLPGSSSVDLRLAYRALGGLALASSIPSPIPSGDLVWLALLPLELLTFLGTSPSPSTGGLSVAEAEDEEDADAVKWGVATFLSCVPFFNWLGWVFAGTDAPDKAAAERLYALAALYGVPSLLKLTGFGQVSDTAFWATIALGALHLQAERVRETSPGKIPSLGGKLAGKKEKQLRRQGSRTDAKQLPSKIVTRLQEALGQRKSAAEQERLRREEEELQAELREAKREERKELRAFDSRLKRRTKELDR